MFDYRACNKLNFFDDWQLANIALWISISSPFEDILDQFDPLSWPNAILRVSTCKLLSIPVAFHFSNTIVSSWLGHAAVPLKLCSSLKPKCKNTGRNSDKLGLHPRRNISTAALPFVVEG